MIVFPNLFSPLYDSEFGVSAPVSEETIRKLVQNMNMLSRLACVGQIRLAQPNIPGAPQPSLIQFQYCDGSEITEPNSPFKTTGGVNRFTPNMTDKYIRGAANATATAAIGAATANFQHDHGGATGLWCHPVGPEDGDEEPSVSFCHDHSISPDLDPASPLDPQYIYLAIYLKIN